MAVWYGLLTLPTNIRLWVSAGKVLHIDCRRSAQADKQDLPTRGFRYSLVSAVLESRAGIISSKLHGSR
jgi:hypothetical protein